MNVESSGDRTGKFIKNLKLKSRAKKFAGNFQALNSRVRSIRFFNLLFFAFLLTASASFCAAQEDDGRDVAPPPLKFMSKEEKAKLEVTNDVKGRTKLALELMEARLLKAETFHNEEKYREMFDELGSFHALMDNTINFLDKSDSNRGKVLNNYKRVELSLRKYVTRLEIIRRDLPIKYEFYVRQLSKFVREARSRAIEPMFDDSVLPGNKPN